jgi:hypothetical protein
MTETTSDSGCNRLVALRVYLEYACNDFERDEIITMVKFNNFIHRDQKQGNQVKPVSFSLLQMCYYYVQIVPLGVNSCLQGLSADVYLMRLQLPDLFSRKSIK